MKTEFSKTMCAVLTESYEPPCMGVVAMEWEDAVLTGTSSMPIEDWDESE